MSNTTTGRFKSKALSYAFAQTRLWMDECGKAFRHTKLAIQWGAQAALYPFYALFKASRMVGRQLQGAVHHAVKLLPLGDTLTSPAVDTPIQSVVDLLEQLVVAVPAIAPSDDTCMTAPGHAQVFIPEADRLNPFRPAAKLGIWHRLQQIWASIRRGTQQPLKVLALAPSAATTALSLRKLGSLTATPSDTQDGVAPRLNIQGVASQLTSRHLVLVMPGNQVLDILTPTQQHQLSARIVWEIASSARRGKVVQQYRRRLAHAKLALGWGNDETALARPVSTTVTPWPQQLTGMIAEWPQPLRGLPAALKQLPVVAERIPSMLTVQRLHHLWQRMMMQVQHFPLLGLPAATALPRLPGTSSTSFGMALDLGFFRFLAERAQIRELAKLQEPTWLTLHDLGGARTTAVDASVASSLPNGGLVVVEKQPVTALARHWEQVQPSLQYILNWVWGAAQWIWHQGVRVTQQVITPAVSQLLTRQSQLDWPSPPLSRLLGQSLRQTLVTLQENLRSQRSHSPTRLLPPATSRAVPAVLAETPEGYTIEFNPTWIEVEPTAVAYVKQPLDQVLDWIDQLFLWIETAAIALWNWILMRLRQM